MITIVCDFYQLHKVEISRDVVVVNSIQDYIPLRQQLRRILDEETRNYTVYVQHRVIARWLTDLTSYEPHIVRWKDINLHVHFEQQFGFSPPKGINEAVMQDLLHTLPLADGDTIADPVGWILSQRVDPIWKNEKPGTEHLVDFAAWILSVQTMPALYRPLMRTRLGEWAQYNHQYQIFFEHSWKDAAATVLPRREQTHDVSSQKSGAADPLVNPGQKGHDESSSANLPHNSEMMQTHDGATPEKIAVPSIGSQSAKIPFIDPLVQLTGILQLHQVGTLSITIENTNIFPISIVQLEVADSVIEMSQRTMKSHAVIKTEVTVPAVNSQEATYPVHWRLTCEGQRQRKEFTGQTAIPIRRLHVSDVDEMFEDEL
ncbi:MAG TPA: hypothetical protein VN207_09335 [Ktedonobacteraceae bacterium]|nr:hypothetical protein [Ktedonobacteraceae bacterium]